MKQLVERMDSGDTTRITKKNINDTNPDKVDLAVAPAQGKQLAPTVINVRLTKAQEQLLDVLRDPACLPLDVVKICKLANITRSTYYQAFRDENFLKAIEAELQKYRHANEFQIMHNIVQQAKTSTNFHWAQMFMQMQGRLQQKQQKPAIVQVNFHMERPPKVEAKVIEAEVEEVDS